MKTYDEFMASCADNSALNDRQGADYLAFHAMRFFKTYEVVSRLLPANARILSVGAGSAYVEAVLADELRAKIYAVDFPEAIALNLKLYQRHDIEPLAGDLSLDTLELPIEPCDMVISAEIVEHIPAAPSEHFRKLAPFVKRGGNSGGHDAEPRIISAHAVALALAADHGPAREDFRTGKLRERRYSQARVHARGDHQCHGYPWPRT